MKLISKEALIKWLTEYKLGSSATYPQIAISKLIRNIADMDCIEIPMTESTYRGKHEVRPC